MIIGYLDCKDKNISLDEQKAVIEEYSLSSKLNIDIYSTDNLSKLTCNLQTSGHTIILANIVGLGDSLSIIKDNLRLLLSHGLKLIIVKEGLFFEDNPKTDWLIKGIELSVDIRSSMLSIIARKALNDKRGQGYKLGRDFGLKNKRYIWEGKEEDIKSKLLSGISRQKIAEEVGMSVVSLYTFLKLHPEIKEIVKGN